MLRSIGGGVELDTGNPVKLNGEAASNKRGAFTQADVQTLDRDREGDIARMRQETVHKADQEKAFWEDEDRKLTTIHFQLPQDPATGMTINSMITTTESPPAP